MAFIYLIIAAFWILIIIIFRKNSSFTLMLSFFLFLAAALFAILNLTNIAEPIMRVSFTGWIIGMVGALIEYKNNHETTK